MNHKRTFIFFLSLFLIVSTSYFVIKIATGYKPDISKKTFVPTGLLVATSVPDGAQIFINNELKSATNNTISLPPNDYQVEIKKDGFHSWKKQLRIEKELVTKTDAYLFAMVPDLKALTFTGAGKPILSPDGTKVIFYVMGTVTEKNGLWLLDLNDFPFGTLREPKQIVKAITKGKDFSQFSYQWSPDSKQLLLTYKQGKNEQIFLIDPNNVISETSFIDISNNLSFINRQWINDQKIRDDQKIKKLPPVISDLIKNKTTDWQFSPDETRILYTATDSAQLAENIINSLPSSSTQAQERSIKPNRIYVYDIKEDRNFFIMESENEKKRETTKTTNTKKTTPTPLAFLPSRLFTLSWFPTSRHLLLIEKNKVNIVEYDGTNKTEVYSGPFVDLFAYAFPSGNKLIVLASISPDIKVSPNLYAVSLR